MLDLLPSQRGTPSSPTVKGTLQLQRKHFPIPLLTIHLTCSTYQLQEIDVLGDGSFGKGGLCRGIRMEAWDIKRRGLFAKQSCERWLQKWEDCSYVHSYTHNEWGGNLPSQQSLKEGSQHFRAMTSCLTSICERTNRYMLSPGINPFHRAAKLSSAVFWEVFGDRSFLFSCACCPSASSSDSITAGLERPSHENDTCREWIVCNPAATAEAAGAFVFLETMVTSQFCISKCSSGLWASHSISAAAFTCLRQKKVGVGG